MQIVKNRRTKDLLVHLYMTLYYTEIRHMHGVAAVSLKITSIYIHK